MKVKIGDIYKGGRYYSKVLNLFGEGIYLFSDSDEDINGNGLKVPGNIMNDFSMQNWYMTPYNPTKEKLEEEKELKEYERLKNKFEK